jgi:hypothetical protein
MKPVVQSNHENYFNTVNYYFTVFTLFLFLRVAVAWHYLVLVLGPVMIPTIDL